MRCRVSLNAAACALLCHHTQVSPERYMEAIAAMGPDVFVALADEVCACVCVCVCV
jgi:hypothetical protein